MAIPEFARRTTTVSRSINAENPTGGPGIGGQAASRLGPGRKGKPCLDLEPGVTTLADISGSGVIRHIWITLPQEAGGDPFVLRNLVLRMTWDDADLPAVEVPLGDFFCCGFAEIAFQQSAMLAVVPNGGLNSYIPMPFRQHAVIEVVNEHSSVVDGFFFQIDYSLGDQFDDDMLYFHAQWRRTNGDNALGEDHVIADITGDAGSYLGTYVGIAALERYWYGEGEIKFFIDDDEELPTIVGTGLEDYVGGAWAFQDHMAKKGDLEGPSARIYDGPYLGYHQQIFVDATAVSPYARQMPPCHGMYRWHVTDPIRFASGLRMTLQQIGDRGGHLFERKDDVTTVAYWYQENAAGSSYRLPDVDARQPR